MASLPSSEAMRARWPIFSWSSEVMDGFPGNDRDVWHRSGSHSAANGMRIRWEGDPTYSGHGANENVYGTVTAQTQTAASEFQQARVTRLQHAQATAGPEAQFRHAANPARLPVHLG